MNEIYLERMKKYYGESMSFLWEERVPDELSKIAANMILRYPAYIKGFKYLKEQQEIPASDQEKNLENKVD